jgi:hypothetical protein
MQFITSSRTVVDDVKIENKIGDAIVHRIIRAHREGTPWKCCILIPALPGFPFSLDHGDASSVSLSPPSRTAAYHEANNCLDSYHYGMSKSNHL